MFGRWTAPSLNAVDKWMPRLWWAAAAVGIAVLAYRNFPWFRSLADNPVFMLVFPLVLTGLRWWFRKRGVAGPLPEHTHRLGESHDAHRDRARFRGATSAALRSGPPVQDDGLLRPPRRTRRRTAAPGLTCTTMRYAPVRGDEGERSPGWRGRAANGPSLSDDALFDHHVERRRLDRPPRLHLHEIAVGARFGETKGNVTQLDGVRTANAPRAPVGARPRPRRRPPPRRSGAARSG